MASNPQSEETIHSIPKPENIHSVEALQYIGFNDALAAKIFQDYTKVGHESHDLIDYAKDALAAIASSYSSESLDDQAGWMEMMQEWGVRKSLAEALVEPGFDDVRSSRDALGWVIEAMDLRWDTLLFHERMKRQERAQQ